MTKAFVAILLILVALAVGLVLGAMLLNRVPLLAPPGLAERLALYLGSNVAETGPDAALPELLPRRFPLAPDALFAAASNAVAQLGWGEVLRDPENRELRAVVTTPILRFRDDILIRVQPEGPEASTLYVLSRSRVGRGDMGANLRHVLDLYSALEASVAPSR